MFLKNHWYVAAWSKDVGREPLGRVLLNESVVLFRKEDGTPVALANRCPHRNLPLSEGKLVGDSLQCGYHGLQFDCDGVCTHVPGQSEIPEWARIRRYPVAERYDWLFVWMGDPARAEESSIPDYHHRLIEPSWILLSGHVHVKGGYRLILDNLLDLSHLTYVHSSTTGNPELAENADIQTEVDGDWVRVTRSTEDIPAAVSYAEYGGFKGNVDRWQFSEFRPPSYMNINNGCDDTGVGAQGAERNVSLGKWGFVVYHALTPETETTTHQFWAATLPETFVDPAKRDVFETSFYAIIEEDLAVYEAQQRAIDLDPNAADRDVNPRGTIPADDGLLTMRRIIRRLYREEQKQAAA